LSAKELPGSDAFSRAPHPRSAAGVSKDGKTLYLVVADGRREGVPGMTLAELAEFMKNELDVCSAINFDGGGSTAMWVGDHVVNKPSDGTERKVSNHLAVVFQRGYEGCNLPKPSQ
jgi:exopolysaccharide biosynthesis protein